MSGGPLTALTEEPALFLRHPAAATLCHLLKSDAVIFAALQENRRQNRKKSPLTARSEGYRFERDGH